MTTEEKQLLVKDICARIPFGLKCTTKANSWQGAYQIRGYLDGKIFLDCHEYNEGDDEWLVQNIVPYLRPIQSMTDEEKSEYANFWSYDEYDEAILTPEDAVRCGDWLDAHLFDYRGLIEDGLALEAPEGIY